jgi:hypothetical protein
MKRRSLADMKEKEKDHDNVCINQEIDEEAAMEIYVGYDGIGGQAYSFRHG